MGSRSAIIEALEDQTNAICYHCQHAFESWKVIKGVHALDVIIPSPSKSWKEDGALTAEKLLPAMK